MLVAATWLEGSVEVPFVVVAIAVGLIIGAMLLYFARRAE